ncbi:YjjW family glycine radical enzyme activase [Hoeflea prorocentri]|uniref:YjjW family glycine radical enzyme activase n=1 Tax=Hoeflea prorocentri TaxID=1922333 RepID=A0A9X3UMH3_9HYPH|nr:YjjW family glycine radical enzyme activase [Hoeflea prorocentri]MCY6383261.1 YjjW family glycine radical enzyme activase [Hoeflea prorocentri]MDA5401061.1 YjjW family glycine radical enzyme activase [Hoeflea prorocentri]
MNVSQANVSKVLTWSCVDGPGNRLVLFLQGCNFACPGCHNPHTVGQCNHCGDCIAACHSKALSLKDGRIAFDADACDACDACLDACPISANPMVRTMGVGDVLQLLRDHRPFLSGITVSGGEATLQAKFIINLFGAMQDDPELAGLSRFIDTNGHLGPKMWDRLLPVTDGVMLDIKAFDPALHRELTGRGNEKSLASARITYAAGKLHELRYLMVPDKTDTPAELTRLKGFVRSLGRDQRVKLNAFQHHGVRGRARDWPKMTKAGVVAAANMLRASGLNNVVTPPVWL